MRKIALIVACMASLTSMASAEMPVQLQSEIATKTGCLGEDVSTCMATLSQNLTVAIDSDVGQVTTDVNGKAISDRYVDFCISPQSNGSALPMTCSMRITAYPGVNRKIGRLVIDLMGSPFQARTEHEYDKTGLYEILSAIKLPKCSNLNKIEVYRWFENKVKPRIKRTHDFDASMSDVSETSGEQATTKFCGHTLFFYSFGGNAVSVVNIDNRTGSYGGSSLTIE